MWRKLGLLLGVTIVLFGGLWGARPFMKPSPVIALIDSGLDLSRAPELRNKLAPGSRNQDLSDSSGHGTQIARIVSQQCDMCRLLPIKVTANGAGALPDALAAALLHAMRSEARVVNISLGLSATSAALDEAIRKATHSGILIMTAAGAGLVNPYRPDSLSRVFPQAFEDVVVIGSPRGSPKAAAPDLLSNFGPELDISIEAESSSFAAATGSGIAGRWLSEGVTFTPSEFRHWLRAQSAPVPNPDFERIGFGILAPNAPAPNLWTRLSARFVPSSRAALRVYETGADISLDTQIRELSWSWDCQGRAAPSLNPLKKGRARVQWTEPFSSRGRECGIHIVLITADGNRLQLKTP